MLPFVCSVIDYRGRHDQNVVRTLVAIASCATLTTF